MKTIFYSIFLFLLNGIQFSYAWSPLLGSEWAREHRQQLPASHCYLTETLNPNRDKNGVSGFTIGIGLVGGSSFTAKYLFCLSDRLQLAYAIPIQEFGIYTAPSLAIPAGFDGNLDFDIPSLNGKPLKSIFSRFRGGKLGFSAIGGGSASFFSNDHEISARLLTLNLGIEVSAGGSTFKLRPRDIQNNLLEWTNPYILTQDTFISRSAVTSIYQNGKGGASLMTKEGLILLKSSDGKTRSNPIGLELTNGDKIIRSHDDWVIVQKKNNSIEWHNRTGSRILRDPAKNDSVDHLHNAFFINDRNLVIPDSVKVEDTYF